MEKSPDAFRTISEVAEFLDTPAHVLRFWESRFTQIRPVKRAGGRRYYRPSDVALLAGIKRLLHDDGLTIRGVQKILREQGIKHVSGLTDDAPENAIEAAPEASPKQKASEPIPLFPQGIAAKTEPEIESGEMDAPEPEADEVPATTPEIAEATAENDEPVADDMTALRETIAAAAADAEATDVTSEEHDAAALIENDKSQPDLPLDDMPAETAPEPSQPEEDAEALDEAAQSALMAALSDDSPVETAEETAEPVDAVKPAPPAPPAPTPPEITGHWLPSDLRALPPGAVMHQRAAVEDVIQRLQTLRNRIADLGHVPRR